MGNNHTLKLKAPYTFNDILMSITFMIFVEIGLIVLLGCSESDIFLFLNHPTI